MAGFTKKIAAQQSQTSVTAIISHTSSQPRILLPLLWSTLQEKTVQARAFVIAHIKQYLEHHGTRSKHAIEALNGLEFLEKSLKKALSDPNPAVREAARVSFWIFEAIWRDRGLVILDTLDSVARKQLEKKCPYPQQMAPPPSTPNPTKKSSVAAAIAASRAKAKAIATAPPTLRHQATSGSHGPLLRRAGSPGTSPRSLTSRPASPLRAPTSPPSPSRSRVSSNVVRSVSNASIPVSRSRSASAGSDRAASPSLSNQSNGQRRGSSPLAASTTTATIRTAIRTALPASPPPSVGHESPKPSPQSGLRNGAAPAPARQPSLLPQLLDAHGDDQSLLMTQSIPGPEAETDSDDEHSVNLLSFSAPFEMYRPPQTSSKSRSINSKLTAPISNALSSGSISDIGSGQPVVEDALRARAEQAESAAERLLELVEPEDEGLQHPILPASLLTGSNRVTPKTKGKAAPLPTVRGAVEPVTPVSRASIVMQHAAMFKDSPAYQGRSTSLLDVLQGRGLETGWWLKRKTCWFLSNIILLLTLMGIRSVFAGRPSPISGFFRASSRIGRLYQGAGAR
jgi:CLIP-associating protein 1/2